MMCLWDSTELICCLIRQGKLEDHANWCPPCASLRGKMQIESNWRLHYCWDYALKKPNVEPLSIKTEENSDESSQSCPAWVTPYTKCSKVKISTFFFWCDLNQWFTFTLGEHSFGMVTTAQVLLLVLKPLLPGWESTMTWERWGRSRK